MKLAATIVIFYAATTLAVGTEPGEDLDLLEDVELLDDLEPFNATDFEDDFEDDFGEDDFSEGGNILEKRRGCTNHRKTTDVCMGKFIRKMNSRHNCLNRGGHCCARNKNRDGGITIRSKAQKGEDCGYCFSGYCKGNA